MSKDNPPDPASPDDPLRESVASALRTIAESMATGEVAWAEVAEALTILTNFLWSRLDRLRPLVPRDDWKDVVQIVLIKVVRSGWPGALASKPWWMEAHGHDADEPQSPRDKNFDDPCAWLFVVMRNAARSLRKKTSWELKGVTLFGDLIDRLGEEASPAQANSCLSQVDRNEMVNLLLEIPCIANLPPDKHRHYRLKLGLEDEAAEIAVREGRRSLPPQLRTSKEVAQALGIPEATERQRWTRLRTLLRANRKLRRLLAAFQIIIEECDRPGRDAGSCD